jgi:hypothetical protein
MGILKGIPMPWEMLGTGEDPFPLESFDKLSDQGPHNLGIRSKGTVSYDGVTGVGQKVTAGAKLQIDPAGRQLLGHGFTHFEKYPGIVQTGEFKHGREMGEMGLKSNDSSPFMIHADEKRDFTFKGIHQGFELAGIFIISGKKDHPRDFFLFQKFFFPGCK